MNSITVKNQYQLTKWAAIIKECNDSGIKIKDWLKSNNISKDQYYYWRRKLQDIASDSLDTSFVEVPVVAPPAVVNPHSKLMDMSTASSINETKQAIATIHLGQVVIDLYDNTSPETLKILLEVIAHA